MGKARKKTRTHKKIDPADLEKDGIPRSFVFRVGTISKEIASLVRDLRQVMEPYTASKLRETRRNKLKDYVHVASDVGITHFMTFSETDTSAYLKLGRVPHGPSCAFKIKEFALAADISNLVAKPANLQPAHFLQSPILVLNGFTNVQDEKIKLMIQMWQNMFPPIDPASIALDKPHRVLLVSYDEANGLTSVRHYLLQSTPYNISRSIKRLKTARVTKAGSSKLNRYDDIASYVLNDGNASDSEAEDVVVGADNDDNNSITSKRSLLSSSVRAIKVREAGPRMDLELIRIQEGLFEGKLLFNAFEDSKMEDDA